MPLRFFRRIPIVGRFITLNVSKGGASVSVGVPGAHITTGTHGTRVTVGLPGTGLFYTKRIETALRAMTSGTDQRIASLANAFQRCTGPNVTADDIIAAIDLQRRLGITDEELPIELIRARAILFKALHDVFGYRFVKQAAPTMPPPAPPSIAVPVTIIVVLIVVSILSTWWLTR